MLCAVPFGAGSRLSLW